MGLIMYLVVGGLIGWIASKIMKTDAQQGVFLNVIVGIVGAFLVGLVTSGGSIGAGITATSIVFSLIGAVVLLGAVNLFRRGSIR